MTKNKLFWLLPVALVLLAALAYAAVFRTVTVVVDGQSRQVRGAALKVGEILRIADIPVGPQDRVTPSPDSWLLGASTIRVERAIQVLVVADGQVHALLSPERQPEKLLAQAGVTLSQGDELWMNGQPVAPGSFLAPAEGYVFQVLRAVPLTVVVDGASRTYTSTAATVAQALWQAGISLAPEDAFSAAGTIALTRPLQADIRHAKPLSILLKDKAITILSAALTVGEALEQGGVTLQGLDYSQPAETEPVPADRKIRVVRVREEVLLDQKTTPFETETVADPNTELDQRSVVDPGQEGLKVTRTHVRYEDGKEVSRQVEAEWQVRPPSNKKIGYGTKVVIHTLDTGAGVIHYWRVITAYATSYSPCKQGYDYCTTGTASGMKLQKGVIGVKKDWFSFMNGQPLFVVGYGYGVVGDYGAGIPGRYFFDLGYSEEDYVSWHNWTTVYFLTPVPAYIPWILP